MSAILLAVALAAAAPAPAAAAAPSDCISGFDTPSGKTFSGDFDQAPADQALRKIFDAGGLSVVMPLGEYGKVSGHFKDAAVEDAVRAVCLEAGLTAARHGTVVLVSRSNPTVGVQVGGKHISVNIPKVVDVETDSDDDDEHADADSKASAMPSLPSLPSLPPAPPLPPSQRDDDRVVTGDVTVGPGEQARDVVALRGNVTLQPGSQARDVTTLAGSIDVGPGAHVEGDVAAVGGDIRVAPGAMIDGDAVSVGGKLIVAPGAKVRGDHTNVNLGLHGLPLALPAAHHSGHSPFLRIGLVAAEFAVCFALGLLFLLGWPRGTERVVHALSASPARSTAVGLLGTVALPVLALLLAATGVGLLLWPVEALLVALATLLGFSALAVLIGRRLPMRARLTPVGQLAVGTALMTLAMNIPKLGPAVLVFAWIGIFGAVLATRFGSQDVGPHPSFPTGEPLDAQPR